MIRLPFWGVDTGCANTGETACLDPKLRYPLTTSATTGVISTQYFGQNFDANKVERFLKYDATIFSPGKYSQNTNITLYIQVEKNIKQELDHLWSNKETKGVKVLNRTESPPGDMQYAYRREISVSAIKDLQMDLMPGFRLTWHYNEKLEADSLMKQLTMYDALRTIQFYRFGT